MFLLHIMPSFVNQCTVMYYIIYCQCGVFADIFALTLPSSVDISKRTSQKHIFFKGDDNTWL